MKNIFKFLGIAFIASSMMVACGPKDETEMYTITANANDATMGTVTGGGEYEVNSTITLEAVANAGYVFVDWEDGTTNNPRIVTVTGDATYTANFAPQTGVKVQLGDLTWNAEYINGQRNSSAFMVAAAQSATSDYPFMTLMCANAPAAGTFNGDGYVNDDLTANAGNTYLHYYESADRGVTLGGDRTGDWWGLDLVINVSAFDATSGNISLVANANMMDIYALTQGSTPANAPRKALTATVSNVTLAAVKGLFAAAQTGKLAAK